MRTEPSLANLCPQVDLTDQDLLNAEQFRRQQQVAVMVVMFSDIEKSTELLESMGEVNFAKVRRQHDELVRAVVEREGGGRCVKHLGDGFMALFAEPSTAVERCLELQDKLTRDCSLRIRIGLDMGQIAVEKAGGVTRDAFGRFVNRAARINASAAGGQTLASYHVWDSAVGWLSSSDVRWRTIGELSVKGFMEPVRCFEFYMAGRNEFQSGPTVGKKCNGHDALLMAGVRLDRPAVAGTMFGAYEIVAEVDSGPMGVIYQAFDRLLNREVWLKVATIAMEGQPDLLARFSREAELARTLRHPNIVSIYDVGEVDQTPYIAMENLEGLTLQQIIEEKRPVSLLQKIGYIIQVCRGLAYAHEWGVVHRDIKPANIVVSRNDTVKLVDFGIAQRADKTPEAAGVVIGTVSHMSPEQVRGERVDARSDIFSVGIVLYELLSGQRPFVGASFTEVLRAIISQTPKPLSMHVPDSPPEIEAIVSRLLEKDVNRRYQTMAEALVDLERVYQMLGGAEQTRTAPEVEAAKAVPTRRARTVLWVDNDRNRTLLAQRMLHGCGAQLVFAVNMMEAARKVVLERYDLVVVVAEKPVEGLQRLSLVKLFRLFGTKVPIVLFSNLRGSQILSPETKKLIDVQCTASLADLAAIAGFAE